MAFTETLKKRRVEFVEEGGLITEVWKQDIYVVENGGAEISQRREQSELDLAALNAQFSAASMLDQIAALTTERDAALAAKAQLEQQLAALQPTADENSVPQVVSMYQARAALIGAGLYDQVNAIVSASDDDLVKVAWEYATTVRRDSAFIAAMAAVLSLDDAAVDQLFIAAAAIQ